MSLWKENIPWKSRRIMTGKMAGSYGIGKKSDTVRVESVLVQVLQCLGEIIYRILGGYKGRDSWNVLNCILYLLGDYQGLTVLYSTIAPSILLEYPSRTFKVTSLESVSDLFRD